MAGALDRALEQPNHIGQPQYCRRLAYLRVGVRSGAMESWTTWVHDGLMGRWKWVIAGAAVCIVGAGLGVFLVSEGLNQASAWVTVLGFPLVLAGGAAGVWSAILAARMARDTRQAGMLPEQESKGPTGESGLVGRHVDAPVSISQHGKTNTVHTGQGDINLDITER